MILRVQFLENMEEKPGAKCFWLFCYIGNATQFPTFETTEDGARDCDDRKILSKIKSKKELLTLRNPRDEEFCVR